MGIVCHFKPKTPGLVIGYVYGRLSQVGFGLPPHSLPWYFLCFFSLFLHFLRCDWGGVHRIISEFLRFFSGSAPTPSKNFLCVCFSLYI